jgi:glycosyltransferase involved in cell wall biosynthesis
MRIDLHVHSRFSKRPSAWLLQKIGCPESFTDPLAIYAIARRRGMSHVTITDHNRIEGALEIAHLPGVLVGEEVTAYFPEDGCKVHVLVLGITEAQHADIQKCRSNIFDLVAYLRAAGILHVAAHPLYRVNDRLTLKHFERLLLLFRHFEINGARSQAANDGLCAMLQNLKAADMERLADRHGIEPAGDRPWVKGLVGGSDDHSSLTIARTHTRVPGAATLAEGLQGIEAGRAGVVQVPSGPKTMAHNFYGIAYQFYRQKFQLGRLSFQDTLMGFMEQTLRVDPLDTPPGPLRKVHHLFGNRRRGRRNPQGSHLISHLRRVTDRLLADNPDLLRTATRQEATSGPQEDRWYTFVNQVSNRALVHFADHAMSHLVGGNVFNIFHSLGSAGGLYALLSPYFIAFSIFARDRAFSQRVCRHFATGVPDAPDAADSLRVAHFTDTFYDTNGVALTIRQQLAVARRHAKHLEVITCNPGQDPALPGVKAFAPVGTYTLPEYPGQAICYPPVLDMLTHCYEQGFTRIHAATPGPIGLAALAIARILKLPFVGTYHTALPQYAQYLTGDAGLEDLTWRYMVWFYDQMEVVYAPSESTRAELIARGLRPAKVRCYPRGIDVERFSPAHRSDILEVRYGVGDGLRLLYVGRLSKEKGLDLLAEVFGALGHSGGNLHLVLVGDGPYRGELEDRLAGLPATFTGALGGDALTAVYASCDLFVFPSTTDTFGNVVLEAQASGLPVIVTDRGGPCEYVQAGGTGLVVKGGDRESLMDALLYMLAHPEERVAMGRRARAAMTQRSFDAAFLQTWQLFREDPPSDAWPLAAGL